MEVNLNVVRALTVLPGWRDIYRGPHLHARNIPRRHTRTQSQTAEKGNGQPESSLQARLSIYPE